VRVLLSFIFLAAAPGVAQNPVDLLLPVEQTVAGKFVDQDGNPLAGAIVGHLNPRNELSGPLAGTDFEVRTRAPWIVVRKPGHWSSRIETRSANNLRVTLRRVESMASPPSCGPGEKTLGLKGWGEVIRFLPTSRIEEGRQGADIDYGIRGYFLKGFRRRSAIQHGGGPLWSLGQPFVTDVWQSVEYSERVFEIGPLELLDARGQTPDERHWRYIGHFGESVTYREADRETAVLFDQFLDGLCLAPLDREGR